MRIYILFLFKPLLWLYLKWVSSWYNMADTNHRCFFYPRNEANLSEKLKVNFSSVIKSEFK